ncbi:MAG TPA: hypothetical protein VE173_16205 [Longimicrobiales bacterium]|jgi:hypothetical protein|nr:hypothetical protein [Longimicrobiales bacterium]
MRQDGKPDHGGGLHEPRGSDVSSPHQGLVFDFAGMQTPDIRDLTLLLTARMLAERDERPVWVRGLPHRSWEVLHAMGLAHLFRLFPSGGERAN